LQVNVDDSFCSSVNASIMETVIECWLRSVKRFLYEIFVNLTVSFWLSVFVIPIFHCLVVIFYVTDLLYDTNLFMFRYHHWWYQECIVWWWHSLYYIIYNILYASVWWSPIVYCMVAITFCVLCHFVSVWWSPLVIQLCIVWWSHLLYYISVLIT